MDLFNGAEFKINDLRLQGLSLSGIRTAISLPEYHLSFDVAQGFPYLLNLHHFFISHGHLDHAAGIPYIISQKAMNSQPAPKFYMPSSLVEPMTSMMKIWEKVEGHEYKYEFLPVTTASRIHLNSSHFIKPFRTLHRIDSFGYTLYQITKKLRNDLQGASREEILSLKNKGEEVNSLDEKPLVSFTGDTQIEFLDLAPEVKKSKVLIVECTYLDERRSVEQARKWGHIHWQELKPRLKEIESEKIVLIHLSSRYPTKEAIAFLNKELSREEKERVVLFPGR